MKTALLIADLEGVTGADSLDALLAGEPAWERARARLTEELNAAVEGLCAQGFEQVRVSDSHGPGASVANVLAGELDRRASLHVLDDAFHASLFEGVSAVACLGMHAGGGVPGFVPHTLELAVAVRAGRRWLSETDLLLQLSAEAQVPAVFVSGDEALAASVSRWRVPVVVSKRALSPVRARSRSGRAVLQALRAHARRPPVPVRAKTLTALELRLEVPDGPAVVRSVRGATSRATYRALLAALAEEPSTPARWLTASFGTAAFLGELERAVAAPWRRGRR